MTKIAVTSRSFSRHPILRAELQGVYPDIRFNDTGLILEGDELIKFLQGCEKAIVSLERIDEAVLSAAPELMVVSKYGVGLDSIDLAAVSRFGVALGWKGGVNRRSVSELVIGMSIALLRHIPQINAELREGKWHQIVGHQLSDKTVGIIGCGHVGKDLARILRVAFASKVLVHDILDFPEYYDEHDIEPVGLEELLSRSDIVTLHIPYDESTRMIMNRDRMQSMKKGAILINTARGGLVDEAALREALENGHLAAAGFDVFDPEPPTDEHLINHPNFLATPHIGGNSEEGVLAMGRAAIAGLEENSIPQPGITS